MEQRGMSEARQTRFKRIFALYDANHDGHIDESDWVIIYERLAAMRKGPGPSREQLVQAARVRFQSMREADADGDGRITEEEFLAHAARSHTGPALSPSALELAHATFRAWDADGDGVINLADSVRAHVAFGLDPRVSEVIATFNRFDLDGDGVIQQGEFLEAYATVLLSDAEVPFIFAGG